ncbi:predicted protein [Clavispora lusitaniae ATCC 42720]|uniref:Uncharacterized protein n=1 Tax=Clavispora lusitaniae (strain ATCC 42720) TaxID=306902 RepID=C4Y667_CLAL4|nr:uncharacterized protein CLUG_03651 [Clavispora lusitaniae ATCC 42720]EEQ39523.1 predicted protein [Clavispora lusitaniae ATCC 42720]
MKNWIHKSAPPSLSPNSNFENSLSLIPLAKIIFAIVMPPRITSIELKQKRISTGNTVHIDENTQSLMNHAEPCRVIRRGKFRGLHDTRADHCISYTCRSRHFPRCRFCSSVPYVSSALTREFHFSKRPLAHSKSQSACVLRRYRPVEIEPYVIGKHANSLLEHHIERMVRSSTLSKAREHINRFTIIMRGVAFEREPSYHDHVHNR